MTTNVADFVDSLKAAVAIPGTFADEFPDTTDDDLAALLLDSFAETQLFGFFGTWTADDLGVVTPDLTRAEGALVVIYATVRMLRTELRNRKTHVRYEASGTVFEQDQGASTLVALLKTYEDEKKAITALGRTNGAATAFYMADQYISRSMAFSSNVLFLDENQHYYGWN